MFHGVVEIFSIEFKKKIYAYFISGGIKNVLFPVNIQIFQCKLVNYIELSVGVGFR